MLLRAIVLFLFSTAVMAFPCGLHGLIYKGDSVTQVLQQCGTPTENKSYTKIVSNMQTWEYYKANTYNQGTAKLSIVIKNNQVVNITTNQHNRVCTAPIMQPIQPNQYQTVPVEAYCTEGDISVGSTAMCGVPIHVGDSAQAVLNACGNPDMQQILDSNTIKMTELRYQDETLIFENDKWVDWSQA